MKIVVIGGTGLIGQKHIQIRPEGATHVGEQEVDGVQRQWIETLDLG